jgi:hypothetical protein
MTDDAPGRWWKRLLWFVALWVAGVAAVSTIAFVIRRILL